MPRNFYRRVELMLEVPDDELARQLCEIFEVYWRDTVKARVLQPDGRRIRRQPAEGETPFIAQNYFLDRIRRG
jgi:polyphosphate kinase